MQAQAGRQRERYVMIGRQVHSNVELARVITEENLLNISFRPVHRASSGRDREAGWKPLEVICNLAIQDRRDGMGWIAVERGGIHFLDGQIEFGRIGGSQQLVDALDMASK